MSTPRFRPLALSIISIAGLAAPSLAQPPARQIPIIRTPTPSPTSAPAPSPAPTSQPTQQTLPSTAPQPATSPVNIGGQTINVTPADAASLAAWQEKLRQFAAFKGQSNSYPRFDGSMGERQTREYVIPVNGGTSQGILTVPANVEIGTWFKGSEKPRSTGGSAAVDSPSAYQQIAGQAASAPIDLPQLQSVEMTPEAVAQAKAKYPTSEGWSEVWLSGGGKIFLKGNPCEVGSITIALHNADLDRPDQSRAATTVDDAYRSYKAWYDSYSYGGRNIITSSTSTGPIDSANSASAAAPPSGPMLSAPVKFSIAPGPLPQQTQAIRDSMKITTDDGRLERALAVSEMHQTATFKQGVQRLADVYLAHPKLVGAELSGDFADLDPPALRKLLTRVVTEANRAPDSTTWTAVAALMTAEGRPERALEMIARARKAATDDNTIDALDKLQRSVNAAIRPGAAR